MNHEPLSKVSILLLVVLIIGIGYFDHQVGFGFHLFPLYLIPVLTVAWKEKLATTLSVSLLAGCIVVFKIFLTRHQYSYAIYWYWDGFVKFALLQVMTYGVWKIRYLSLAQQKQCDAQLSALNKTLKQQVEQLTAINRELEEFSYTISHDLRAPIRHITGFLNMLNTRDLSTLDEKSRHYLQVVTGAAHTMGMLIDALLAYSRLGRTQMLKSTVDLNLMVREVVQKVDAGERELAWDIAPLPTVVADPGMLRQVMENLVGNAVKFTQSRPQGRIEIGGREEPEEVQIYVRDNGAGFDNRYVHKIFGMFQRLHTTEQFEGIGAGLAMVERIVLRHGGRVWAEGAIDGGATVWFSLPKNPS